MRGRDLRTSYAHTSRPSLGGVACADRAGRRTGARPPSSSPLGWGSSPRSVSPEDARAPWKLTEFRAITFGCEGRAAVLAGPDDDPNDHLDPGGERRQRRLRGQPPERLLDGAHGTSRGRCDPLDLVQPNPDPRRSPGRRRQLIVGSSPSTPFSAAQTRTSRATPGARCRPRVDGRVPAGVQEGGGLGEPDRGLRVPDLTARREPSGPRGRAVSAWA